MNTPTPSLLPAHFVGSGQAVGLLSISAAAVDEHTADPLHSGGSQLLFLNPDVSLMLRQEQSQGLQEAQCPSAGCKKKWICITMVKRLNRLLDGPI